MDDPPSPVQTNGLDDARAAIRRAHEAGYLDDDATTVSLLAITAGARRMHQEQAREAASSGSDRNTERG